MPGGGSKPGERRGGRKKGTPNKIPSAVRQAFQHVFEAAQRDKGHPCNLTNFAKTHPEEFMRVCSKLIPNEIKADLSHTMTPDVALTLKAMVAPPKAE